MIRFSTPLINSIDHDRMIEPKKKQWIRLIKDSFLRISQIQMWFASLVFQQPRPCSWDESKWAILKLWTAAEGLLVWIKLGIIRQHLYHSISAGVNASPSINRLFRFLLGNLHLLHWSVMCFVVFSAVVFFRDAWLRACDAVRALPSLILLCCSTCNGRPVRPVGIFANDVEPHTPKNETYPLVI